MGCMERIMHNKANIDDNGISCGTIDEDGIIIKENVSGTGVYIYYTEIDEIIQQMRKLKYLHSGNSMYTKKTEVENTREDKNLSDLKAYYETDEWKKKRMARLKMDAFRCVNCGSCLELEVHHKSYGGVYGESVRDDLVTLCHVCHGDKTVFDRSKRGGHYYG